MDLAAFSGRSLEESAMALTRAYGGNTRILKEFGVEVEVAIAQKASEHMSDPDRIDQARKIRAQEEATRQQASDDFWGV